MGNAQPIAMGRGSNQGRQGQTGIASFVNIYVEDLGETGKTPFTAQTINGWRTFSELSGTAGVNAMIAVSASQALVVHGRTLSSIGQSGGSPTVIGGIASDGIVSMARNRKTPNPQIAIVRDGLAYVFEAGTLSLLGDPDLPPPICVVELDGYFIYIIRDGRFFLGGPNASTIDPIDFAEAESSSDNNVWAIVRGRSLIIFGLNSFEVWDPNGDATFPLGRTTTVNVGCYAAGSVAKVLVQRGSKAMETVIFAATDPNGAYAGIMLLEGYTPVPISTGEVDRMVRDAGGADNVTGSIGWTEDGRPFYILTTPTKSMCFDAKSGEWHQRGSKSLGRWRASCHLQFGGYTLFGATDRPKIYKSLPDVYDEDGEDIGIILQPPPIHMWPKWFKVDEVHIDAVSGVGLNSSDDDEAEPKVWVDYSKDGGDSFGPAREYTFGAQAKREVRIMMRGLGRFNHNGLTLRLRSSAKTIKTFQQLAIAFTPLG
jgi:hypothetical protein